MKEISHLTQEQIFNIIIHLPFFTAFDPAEQMLFAGGHARIFCYRTGEFLIQEGGDDHSLFLLLTGAASVVKEGSAIPLAMLGPGDIFGEVGFLMQRKRTTNVIVHPPSSPVSSGQSALWEQLAHTFASELPQEDPLATTVTIQWHRAILQQLERETRIKLKNLVIQRLMTRLDTMNERVTRLTGAAPLLSLDEELERTLQQEQTPSLEMLETTKERIIEQLIGFVEELNRQLLRVPPPDLD
ncbi:MAG: cyclic nucleotide-binding domain-containing protein [Magnetococcus sp. XQGC-1]